MSDPDAPSRRRPKRSLGQNFLVNDGVARRIVELLGAGPADEVLEIGPGRGALTRHLVGAVGRLVLVELDDALAGELERAHEGRPDVTVVHDDVLEVDLDRVVEDRRRLLVVGNVPYNITTPIVFKLLERPRPERIVLTVQREVAERIVAPPGGRTYGALAVGVQSVADAEIVLRVRRGSFRPVPKVESAVVRIVPRDPPPLDPDAETRLRDLVRALFQWRRKQLGTILRDHPDLEVAPDALDALAEDAGVTLSDRPERLAPEDFARLAAALGRR